MKKKQKKTLHETKLFEMNPYIPSFTMVQEFVDAEKEFGSIVTDAWEVINQYPTLHKNVLKTARKLRELKFLMKQYNLVDNSVN